MVYKSFCLQIILLTLLNPMPKFQIKNSSLKTIWLNGLHSIDISKTNKTECSVESTQANRIARQIPNKSTWIDKLLDIVSLGE